MESPSDALASSMVKVAPSVLPEALSLIVPVPVSVAVMPDGASETPRPTVKTSLVSTTSSCVVETVKVWVSLAVPVKESAVVFSSKSVPSTAVESVKLGVTVSPPCTALSSVTVKVMLLPSAALASLIVTAALSFSSIVSVAEFTVNPVALPATPTVSSPSYTLSSVEVSTNVAVPLVLPALILTSKSETAS